MALMSRISTKSLAHNIHGRSAYIIFKTGLYARNDRIKKKKNNKYEFVCDFRFFFFFGNSLRKKNNNLREQTHNWLAAALLVDLT